jgi:glycosyltransferase involved in cell wall biosynthesis
MISYVIPAFNESALIQRCIDSIHRECEDWINYEIIVVDNGSTDLTAEIARSCGAMVITEPTKGVTRARQKGLEVSAYGLVAFIDADNEIPPGWAVCAIGSLQFHKAIAASGPVVYDDMPLRKRIVVGAFYSFARLTHMIAPMLQGGNFILRKDKMVEAGGFNTALDFYGEDTDTAMRLSKLGKIRFELGMWVWSSSRRFDREGLTRVGFRYIANYVWMWATGKPWTVEYLDHRRI